MSYVQISQSQVPQSLQKKLSLQNPHAIPRITKIVINSGIGTYMKNEKSPEPVLEDLQRITGRKPQLKKARLSVSNFKLREGMPVGASVTLRGEAMYNFLERLVQIALPRIRDFRGVSKKAFDGRGNYSLGLREHLIFPEIPTDKIVKPFGMQITICTTAEDDAAARMLLEEYSFPFQK